MKVMLLRGVAVAVSPNLMAIARAPAEIMSANVTEHCTVRQAGRPSVL